jgi:hypothetical protein
VEVKRLIGWRRWGRGRRAAAVVLVSGLAAVALAMVLVTVATARPLGFLHLRTNLSLTETLVSAYPELAISPDGDRVITVWTEEHRSGVGFPKGDIWLRVASEVEGGWGEKVKIYESSDSACAYDVALAITDTDVHVAYIVFNDSCANPKQTLVYHNTCSLTTGQCSESPSLVASAGTERYKITWVDLALDAQGAPHIVWAQYDANGRNGVVYYRTRQGTEWGETERVTPSYGSNTPSIAWANGYVHVVWEDESEHRIWYRQRGESGWDFPEPLMGQQTHYPPSHPDVAAQGERVFVVWDWCGDIDTTPPCWDYVLVYRRSNDNGTTWGDTLEVGTDELGPVRHYDSVDDALVREAEYLLYLQPSIALNQDGWPSVVWHADRSGGGATGYDYAIYYSYAVTGTDTTVEWEWPAILTDHQTDSLGAPAVGIGEPGGGGEQHLHVAYMQAPELRACDVFYNSNEGSQYEYIYLPITMRSG